MGIESKTESLIVKLNKLTATGEITWRAEDPPKSLIHGTDDQVPLFFVCNYKEQRIAIFQRRYQTFIAEYEQFYWTHHIVLALLDDSDRILWEFYEETPALRDLFETVRRKVSKVDTLLDELLEEG